MCDIMSIYNIALNPLPPCFAPSVPLATAEATNGKVLQMAVGEGQEEGDGALVINTSETSQVPGFIPELLEFNGRTMISRLSVENSPYSCSLCVCGC